jgi:anti-sigma B factor antagonist
MEITRSAPGDIAVIEIHGKLVGTVENCEKLHVVIREVLDAGTKRIVIGLGDTPWANSQGIGMLIGAFTSAKNAGARLVLAEVGGRIRDVLAVTRLDLVFELHDTIAQAVERFAPGAPASARDAERSPRRLERAVDLGLSVSNGQE